MQLLQLENALNAAYAVFSKKVCVALVAAAEANEGEVLEMDDDGIVVDFATVEACKAFKRSLDPSIVQASYYAPSAVHLSW